MTTITLELPDDLANRLESVPPQERNRFAVAALRVGTAALAQAEDILLRPAEIERAKRQEAGSSLVAFAADIAARGHVVTPPLTQDEIYEREE